MNDNDNNKNTDSRKLKHVHLMVKELRKPAKSKRASQRSIALLTVCIGIIIIVAVLGLLIFM